MSFYLKTKPSVEPVTADYVKLHTRIDGNAEDSLLNVYIQAAREYAEAFTWLPIITQTWVYKADCFKKVIELKPNLQAVSNIKYIDGSGVQQTLSPTMYDVNISSLVGHVYPAYNQSWPSVLSHRDVVEIEFIAGFGDDGDDVPAAIKQAICMIVAHWYENRVSVTDSNMNDMPHGVDMLLWNHKVMTL